MSSIPLFKRFIRKTSQASPPQQQADRTTSPSFYAPESSRTSSGTQQRPTVNIPKEAFPYYTQVSWPPQNSNKSKPASIQPTQAVVQAVATTASLPVQEPVTHSNAFKAPVVKPQTSAVISHPESLIPARPSATVPHLIDIPIDSGPAFDDDMFRRKSNTNSGQNSPDPKTSNSFPQGLHGTFGEQFSFPGKDKDKSSDQQVITIPIGRQTQRPSSPSVYSESSSTYSYVSAPELEYGYDDSYRLSSPRSHRLTRKDSTTLPQELVLHLLHGGGTRNREDDDDRRSRHSSVGKRSVKSRRNSDGGASVHTARRSTKSNSRADTFDSVRSHSRNRSTKAKQPRVSGASLTSSLVSSTASPAPSTIVYGHRTSVFPSPNEPMPAHALKVVQAVQAILEKESPNLTPNATLQFSDKSTFQRETKHLSSSRKTDINNNTRNTSTLSPVSALEKSQARNSFMEYLDSPSDEVTLPAVLTGYNLPRTQRGRNTMIPHAYANTKKPSNSNSNPNPVPLRKDAPLPPMPDSPPLEEPSPPPLPTKTKSHSDFSEFGQRSSPPVLPFPITHDKSQSDSLYPEISDKYGFERTRMSYSYSQPSTSASARISTSIQPPPGPSRPLPARPAAVSVSEIPVAGPSKPNKCKPARDSLFSRFSSDQKSRKTIQSDQTIKPISMSIQTSNGGTTSSRNVPTYFKDGVPSSTPPPPPPLSASTSKQDKSSPRSESLMEEKPVEEKITQGNLENERTIKSSSEATLQVLTTTSPSETVQQQPQQLTPDMASAPCSSTSPSSYSSLPVSSDNVTSVCSVDVSATKQDDVNAMYVMKQNEDLSALQEKEEEEVVATEVTARNVSLSSNETEKQIRGYKGMHDLDLSCQSEEMEGDLSKDRAKGISEESPAVTVEGTGNAPVPDPVIPEAESHVDSETDKKQDLQKVEASDPVDASPEKAEEDRQPDKEDAPSLSENIISASNSKDQDLNAANELRKSIHDSSNVSIPWNSSTGSIGSQRHLKNGHYMNPSFSTSSFALEDGKSVSRKPAAFNVYHAQGGLYQDVYADGQNAMSNVPTLRPEQYPLPRSLSSVELPLPSEDQKGVNDSCRPMDGRTSSPNAFRTRPFSPHESVRSLSSHNKQNRSMGDVSQDASGFSEAAKMSSLSNQRPPSRSSSTYMPNGVITRGNRSSTLPTFEGVSPTPVPSQNNKTFKATLPIGNKTPSSFINEVAQVTRTRSGSEPHPSIFQHRSPGRLSTIQQSPIQHTRPNALPLRHERAIGSMSFPETPYEYTPMATPGVNGVASPHARGPGSTSYRQRKTSRLGSDVSLRRPAGPRPPRNQSNINNNNNNNNNNANVNANAKNASSKFASPPNTARSFDFNDPASDGGASTDFRPRPVEWRAYTLEAALWTFTSEQLQEMVGRAIRQSAVPSTVRLLTVNALDEIKPEIERLEILRQDVTIRYCANVTRRRVILKSLKHHLMDADWTKRSQLVQELNDTSYLADQLTRDLFHTMYRLQQLYRLMDVHNGSALAMALRKLNSSFVKQLDDMSHLTQCLAQSEAEKEEAWATAERMEREVMELRDKLETMAMANQEGNSSENSSRRDSARKPSVRASKASFRLSRARFSHASSNSSNAYYPFSPVPPVPPIPRNAQVPNSRILSLSLNTDISSSGAHSIQSAQSFGFSPTPEQLALEKAQRELYDLLGLSRRPRKSLPSRPRPASEILSPVTASDGPPLSAYKQVDHPLRRNNSIPISPYIISEQFR